MGPDTPNLISPVKAGNILLQIPGEVFVQLFCRGIVCLYQIIRPWLI
jgi:hypothetical protein